MFFVNKPDSIGKNTFLNCFQKLKKICETNERREKRRKLLSYKNCLLVLILRHVNVLNLIRLMWFKELVDFSAGYSLVLTCTCWINQLIILIIAGNSSLCFLLLNHQVSLLDDLRLFLGCHYYSHIKEGTIQRKKYEMKYERKLFKGCTK